jgi:hypothetical protein
MVSHYACPTCGCTGHLTSESRLQLKKEEAILQEAAEERAYQRGLKEALAHPLSPSKLEDK